MKIFLDNPKYTKNDKRTNLEMLDCIIAIVLFKVSIMPVFSSIQETKFEIIAEELSFGVGLQFNFNIPQKKL